MTISTIVRDDSFKLINEFIKPDKKKRITLGIASSIGAFNVYLNKFGQLILDPVKAVPASEAWLYENKKALASVKKGLKESADGKVHSLGSFAKFIEE
ncbi:MAG: hypothetical protein A3F67_10095 [Verrucomicrobia bacterium RIFCSPHIGHO2_12_FULL_41_10]|nr:MAG: hypothetical protein A3F67_10095 [Verrucomicrobia bacterium RIFCSPHIGHO2_12_FULL_41_10]